MEDLIGILIFLGFAAFSVIGNLAKKKQASTDPVGNKGSGGTSLKDILASLQEELLGKTEITEEEKPKVRKKNVHKPESELVEELFQDRPVIKVKEPSKDSAIHTTSQPLTKEQLRRAIMWKEILSPPVSLR